MAPRPASGAGGASTGHAADDDDSRLVSSLASLLGSEREARWIVEHVESGGAARSGHPGRPEQVPSRRPSGGREERARALAERRAAGEPLQYVLGRWPFRELELDVDPRVLIPRPETEQVVEVALAEFRRIRTAVRSGPSSAASGRSADQAAGGVCVDLGTGSGAIALSLAVEAGADAPGSEVWATDESVEALAVARQNLAGLAFVDPAAAERVRLAQGSWFDALPPRLAGRVDLLVSNPPYVAASEYTGLEPTVRDWEPRRALVAERGVGGVGGMADIEAIIAGARRWLHRSGAVVIEIAPLQAYASIDAARRAGFGQVATERDLAGSLRMLVARC